MPKDKKRDKRQRPRFEDDGRVIAPMNVSGMPWHQKDPGDTAARPVDRPPEEIQSTPPSGESVELIGKKEARWAAFGAVGAALAIAGVFAAVFGLLIWLMVTFWT